MRTPDEVFIDYKQRKNGILSALCEDVDSFFAACDPASENLCLYGNPDGSWVSIRTSPSPDLLPCGRSEAVEPVLRIGRLLACC